MKSLYDIIYLSSIHQIFSNVFNYSTVQTIFKILASASAAGEEYTQYDKKVLVLILAHSTTGLNLPHPLLVILIAWLND
jgi:hypothetical protein